MAHKYLDDNGLLYFWQKIKVTFLKVTDYVEPVQSDWNTSDSSALSYIKNKPTIPPGVVIDDALSTTSENAVQNKIITNALNGKVPESRKINNKALSADVTLTASDVSAIPNTEKGSASGVCPLNASGKVDTSYLPSFVDDVIEGYPVSGATPLSAGWLSKTSGGSALTPEQDKIYILMADSGSYSANSTFRWSGSTYVLLSDGNISAITNAEIDIILAS